MTMPSAFLRSLAATMLLVLLALAPRAAEAVDPSYSGSWYRPEESGSGFNLEIFSDERALLFWYTYDDNGEAVWLYSEGLIDGESIEFDVFYADGMRFNDLDPADKNNRPWGTLTMQFLGCNDATISYQSTLTGEEHSPVGTRVLPVQRLVNIATLPCRREASGYWVGRHFDPTLEGGQGAWADLSGVTTEDGRVFFSSQDSGEVFIGEYIADGDTIAFEYEACEEDGVGCFDAIGTATYANKDFINGEGTSAPYGTQPLELTYRTLYDRSVNLASIAGTYSFTDEGDTYTMAVLPDGAVTVNATNGCTFAGQLVQPDAEFNLFEYTGTSSCFPGTMEGVAVNIDVEAGDRKALEFRILTSTSPLEFVAIRP